MKICYVSPYYPETVTMPDEMLASWLLLRHLPPALAAHGFEVVVLAHADRLAARMIDGVRYRFVDPGPTAKLVGRVIHRWKPRFGPAYYFPAGRLLRAIREERPDVVHVSGLTLDVLLMQIATTCSRHLIPLVVHFHGGVPEPGKMQWLQRWNAARIERVFVTTREQAEPWVAAGLYEPDSFAEVVETSSPFAGIDRVVARAKTRMLGEPVYLSAGRLDAIKDPITMLRGFEAIAIDQPSARLFLYFLSAELMPEIRAFLSHRPRLAERVEFRDRARLDEMEAIYSSADFLLQASLREWSGLSVIEAMSCGCIPIVSNIPSFRVITGDGSFGKLFDVGDDRSLARAALSISADERSRLSLDVRGHFHRELSFEAMVRKISAVYRDVAATGTNRADAVHESDAVSDG